MDCRSTWSRLAEGSSGTDGPGSISLEQHLHEDFRRQPGDVEPLDKGAQLADVARPRIVDQRRSDRGTQRDRLAAVAIGKHVGEVLQQRRHVFGPLAERRQHDADDVQPVIQVAAELPGANHVGQVAVRAGQEAGVNLDGNRPADGHYLLLLKDAEQLRLEGEGDFGDFVEENGAPVGGADDAEHVLLGPGERPADMAEELALKERFADPGAVDGNKGLVVPIALAQSRRAINSLPVPLSPSIKTQHVLHATRSTRSRTS